MACGETWEKQNGRYVCLMENCPHWDANGCLTGKVTLTCDNEECEWHGADGCKYRVVHLDADGKCLGFKQKL